jgi:PAS domain S-box-containing protein/putative nucleotidyltransferase with HDIG domain
VNDQQTAGKGDAGQPGTGSLTAPPKLWRHVLDAITDPLFFHDAQFRILLANRAYCLEAGVTEAEALGRPYWQVFPLGDGPSPGWRDAWRREDVDWSQEGVSVGAKLFLSLGYKVRDDQGAVVYALNVLRDVTEQRQTEDALQQSQAQSRLLLNTLPQKIFYKDRDCVYVSCNANFARDLGIAEDEITGHTDFDFFPQAMAEKYRADDQRLIAAGETEDIEEQYILGNRESWIHTVKTPMRDEKGEITGILGIFWDVTGIRRTAQALAESEARFRGIAESAGDAIITVDGEEGVVTSWNPAAEAMFGYGKEEVIGQVMHEIIAPPRFREAARSGMGRLVATREGPMLGRTEEEVALHKNGTEFPVEVSISAMQINGKWCATGIVRDITERKRAEALRKSKELLQTVVETAPARIFWKDRDFRYLGCNTRFAKDAGRSRPDELTGKTDFDMGWKDQAEAYRADDRVVMESGVPKLDYEEPQTTPDGSTIWVRTSKTPLRDENNQIIGLLGIYQDITEHKRATEELKNLATKYRALFESSSDAIMLLDEKGFFDCNTATLQMFRCSAYDEFVGKHPSLFSTPTQPGGQDSMSLAHERITAALRDGSNLFEWMHRRLDGTDFRAEVLLTALELGGKRVLQATVRDISEKKWMYASEEHYRRIFETAEDGLLVLNAETGMIVDANPFMARTLGFSQQEFLDKRVWELNFFKTVAANKDEFLELQRKDYARYEDLTLETAQGQTMHVEFVCNVYLAGGAKVMQCNVRDISRRNLAERESRRLSDMHTVRNRISEVFLTVLDEQMYQKVLTIVQEALKSPDGVFGYLDENGAWAVPTFTGTVWDQCKVAGKRSVFPPEIWGDASWAKAIREKCAICVNESSQLLPEDHISISRHISLPLINSDAVVGLIQVANKDSDYSQADIDLMEILGGAIAPVLDARLKVERQNAARELASKQLVQLNRMYRTISRCNETLVRASDEVELCRMMCGVLTEEGGFCMAWVGYAHLQDPDKCIELVAAAGVDEGGVEDLKRTYAGGERAQESAAATAIRTGEIKVFVDILNDDQCSFERELALRFGYSSIIAIPLKLDQNNNGVLVVCSSQSDGLTDDVIRLLIELGNDLVFGIGNLRSRAERIAILEKLERSLDHAVAAIAATVEMRDPYTAGHQRRVAKLAVAVATEMGLSSDKVEGLRVACVVHDIGKIHVPAEILSNPGGLSSAEVQMIETHSRTGWEILKGIDFPWPVAEIVYQHHERLDGTGYPRGLKGDEILLEARILAVADVVEAMTSHRPYRAALGVILGLQEISRNKGVLYDATAVDACLRLFTEKNYEF